MWISREAAFSDVVLAPAGIVLGGSLFALLPLVPGWPGGLVGAIVGVVLATVLMIWWPTWLARQRGEPNATPAPLDVNDVVHSALLSVPVLLAGVGYAVLEGVPVLQAAFGRFAQFPLGVDSLVEIVRLVIAALGTFLVVVLVARRAPEAFPHSPPLSVTAGLRTYGMGLAAGATVLQLLYSLSSSPPISRGLLVGLALAGTVLLADRHIQTGLSTTRAAVLTPAIVVAVLWVLQGGLLFGGPLLPRLAFAATGATLALCVGVLVQSSRTWTTVLVPLVSAVWLQAIIPPV